MLFRTLNYNSQTILLQLFSKNDVIHCVVIICWLKNLICSGVNSNSGPPARFWKWAPYCLTKFGNLEIVTYFLLINYVLLHRKHLHFYHFKITNILCVGILNTRLFCNALARFYYRCNIYTENYRLQTIRQDVKISPSCSLYLSRTAKHWRAETPNIPSDEPFCKTGNLIILKRICALAIYPLISWLVAWTATLSTDATPKPHHCWHSF